MNLLAFKTSCRKEERRTEKKLIQSFEFAYLQEILHKGISEQKERRKNPGRGVNVEREGFKMSRRKKRLTSGTLRETKGSPALGAGSN